MRFHLSCRSLAIDLPPVAFTNSTVTKFVIFSLRGFFCNMHAACEVSPHCSSNLLRDFPRQPSQRCAMSMKKTLSIQQSFRLRWYSSTRLNPSSLLGLAPHYPAQNIDTEFHVHSCFVVYRFVLPLVGLGVASLDFITFVASLYKLGSRVSNHTRFSPRGRTMDLHWYHNAVEELPPNGTRSAPDLGRFM
jgi:hypothetical protein